MTGIKVAIGRVVAVLGVVLCCAAALTGGASAAAPANGLPPYAVVPQPPPTAAQLAQAAADRPDPFVPPRHAPRPLAVSLPPGTWQPLGPAPQGATALQGPGYGAPPNSGRVTSIVVLTSGTLSGRVIIGSASGGIWTSDDNGATWTPRTDHASTLAIGSLAVDPSNPMHVIAGTGEDDDCGDCYWGAGILSSTDGGTTWTLQDPGGVFDGTEVAQVAIDPRNSSDMFAATSNGLYETTNGGTTWAIPTVTSYTNNFPGPISAVVIDGSTNPSTVYIAGTDSARTAVLTGKSTDGGATWAPTNSGIASPDTGGDVNVALAIASPPNQSTLYASVGSLNNPVAVYKTTSGGSTWAALTAPDYTGQTYAYGSGTAEQGDYDNVIAVDPTNANHVLAGGIAMAESTDGGATWVNTNGGMNFDQANYDHPDHHALAFAPGGKVWVGDDGGVYLYTPGTAGSPPTAGTFVSKNTNLNTIQFYEGFNVIGGTLLGGTQDNASAETTSSVLSGWTEIYSGDGAASAITPNDPAVQFIQADASLQVTTDGFATMRTDITPPYNNSIFAPPMTVVPNTTTPGEPTVFYGADGVYVTHDPIVASPNTPSWTRAATSFTGLVTALGASPSNPSVIYAGYRNGTIQVSTDAGATWTTLATQPFTPDTWITGISVDPANPDAITVSVSTGDTRSSPALPHIAQYVWTTVTTPTNGNWTVITGNLPNARPGTTGPSGFSVAPEVGVSKVIYDNGALIAATDGGVYGTTAPNGNSTTWTPLSTGLPNVQVVDLYVDSSTGDLYAITHGRGAWLLPPQPVVSSVTPAAGPVGGGTSVTITGTGLSGATAVDFGSTAATITNDTGTSITVTAPAGAAGPVGVTVTTAGGTSATSPSDQFTYDPTPTVTGLSLASGPPAGGGTETVTGTGFVSGAAVNFGGTAAGNVTVVSATQITATVPAGSAGTVDVTVTTPGGTSATGAGDRFTYVQTGPTSPTGPTGTPNPPVPTVTAVSPSAGPVRGGERVTISGTGFAAGAAVSFGQQAASNVTVSSAGQLTVTVPAGSPGVVDVTVAGASGRSAISAADRFAYDAVPTITKLSVTHGKKKGGAKVTITGTGFVPGAVFSFGSSKATIVSMTSTKATVKAPKHADGKVSVTVKTPGGTSKSSKKARFTYKH